MPQRWRSILLSLSAVSLLLGGCKKNFSSDTPLPTSYYPSIIINNDNEVVYALNPANGTKNWQFGLSIPSNYMLLTPSVPIVFTPSPLLYNENVYIAYSQRDPTKTDTVFRINAKTGALIAKILPNVNEHFNIQATPIAANGLVYIAGDNGKVYAIDTATNTTRWEFAAVGPIISSPTIYGGNLYFGTTNGTVYCLDATLGAAGASNWTYKPTPVNTSATASFYSSPAISAPYLYIGSTNDSNMYCIYLNTTPIGGTTGVERWRYKTQGPIYSSPATYAGTCIFGCGDFRVYCLDTSINPTSLIDPTTTPSPRWVDSLHSNIYSSPYVYNQVVYIGCYDYNLYALNIINGGIKWKFASKGLIKSSPVAYNGLVYVGSYDMSLYALDTSLGNIQWQWNTNGQIEDAPVIDDLSGDSYNSGISGFCNGGYGNLFYTSNANNF